MTTAPAPTPTSTTPTADLAVELRGLRKTFGPVTAVDGIDLSIRRGEIVAFLGPNGAGKTTTIDMLLGLARPTSGEARVFGMDPQQATAHGLVSAVMQTGGLLKDLTVRETVQYLAALFPTARPVGEVLETAGVSGFADRKVGTCSAGEQQRLRFALALVPDPDFIILDEPTTGMDVNARREFWSAIRADTARRRTVLFATHYLEEADAYADRIVLVREGRIVADGTPAQIRALGSGRVLRANWPGATLEDLRPVPAVTEVEIRGGTVVLHVDDSDAAAHYLLTATPATELTITARGIEDAFVALTQN